MASAIPPILVELVADVSKLKDGMAQAQSSLRGLDQNVKTAGVGVDNFTNKIKKLGQTFGIAFAGVQVLNFLKQSVVAANEASASQERLAKLLLTTGGATEAGIAALREQAAALEKLGVVSKANIAITQSQLATFDLTGNTIKTLTPAILDYVTAEKGAGASADEFKALTNGLAQALNGNFTSLTKTGFVLDAATKKLISTGSEAERAAAIVKVLNSTYKGFNESLRDTNPIQVAINELGNLKEDIGNALKPAIEGLSRFIIDKLIPALRSFAAFIKNNSAVILTFVGALTAGYVALKTYQGILLLTAAAQRIFAVASVLMRGAQLASIASTNGLAASMLVLNATIRANPIGFIVTAVAALAAGFVVAWKNSETFRTVIIAVAKAALTAIGFVIRFVGVLAEGIVNLVTGPMKLFLKLLSFVSPEAKKAYDGLSDMTKGVGKWFDDAATKVDGFKSKLDGLAKTTAKEVKPKLKVTADDLGGAGRAGGLTDAQIKELAGYQKDVLEIYDDMNKAIAEGNKKMAEETKSYNEEVAALNADYAKDKLKSEKQYTEQLLRIAKSYNDSKAKLDEDLALKQADIRKNNAESIAKLEADALVKQQNVIQKSIDQLRSAFASGISFSIKDNYVGGAGGLVNMLRRQLTGAQDLQKNAAALAGKGYTQTFIEQIVSAGPTIGNEMAASILRADETTQAELKSLYGSLNEISDIGMDAIGKSMNSGANLATKALLDEYKQVSIDLKANLVEQNNALNNAILESNADYTRAIRDLNKTRDEANAQAYTDLQEALAEAQVQLTEALAKTQKNYQDAIDKIAEATNAKIADLKIKLQEVAALMAALGAANAAALALKNAPVYVPPVKPNTTYVTGGGITTPFDTGASSTISVSNTFNNASVNPGDVSTATLNAIKYGIVITSAGNILNANSANVRENRTGYTDYTGTNYTTRSGSSIRGD